MQTGSTGGCFFGQRLLRPVSGDRRRPPSGKCPPAGKRFPIVEGHMESAFHRQLANSQSIRLPNLHSIRGGPRLSPLHPHMSTIKPQAACVGGVQHQGSSPLSCRLNTYCRRPRQKTCCLSRLPDLPGLSPFAALLQTQQTVLSWSIQFFGRQRVPFMWQVFVSPSSISLNDPLSPWFPQPPQFSSSAGAPETFSFQFQDLH